MAFLMNCWYVAAFANEVSRKPFSRTLLDVPVVFYRTEEGQPVALDNRCPHRYAPLDRGKVIGDRIQCAYHGLQFNPAGQCVAVPSGDLPPPRAKLRAFPVVERDTLLWIWMGDDALADPGLIKDFSALTDPAFGWANAYIYAKANYQLIVDNLMDPSHAEFLHEMLSSDGWTGINQQKIKQEDGTLYCYNVAEESRVLPLMQLARPELPPVGKNILNERWDAPSCLYLSIEYYGDGKQIVIPAAHFLTPETSRTTHYFSRSGHDWDIANPATTEAYRLGLIDIFEKEDIGIIEVQQKMLGDVDLLDHHLAVLKHDSMAIRARRMLAKMIREENGLVQPSAVAAE